jgi:membrane-associated protease RseP (regulator of RpoE activity)
MSQYSDIDIATSYREPVPTEKELLTQLVARVLVIEDITTGEAKSGYQYRFRGRLYGEPQAAYDQLASSLRPHNFTPLFRLENGQHIVLLVQGVINPRPSRVWVNLLLLALTILSVFFIGVVFNSDTVGQAIAYTASLMAILLAHEFGHYLAGRFHKTHVTLPYFLPVPWPPFGTMGAFIQMKEPPKNRRILLDIGIAGPLAGLAVAIPILLLGLSLSPVDPLPASVPRGLVFTLEGNSILYLLSKFVIFGQLLPAPSNFGGLPPLLYWMRYFFTGQPLPLGGVDVLLHPVAWAGWAGLLITGINLIPAGQLDGGHLLYVLFGRRARMLLPVILAGLIVLSLITPAWWLMTALIFLLGRTHAEPLDQITPVDSGRKFLAVLGLVIFFLVFTPVPLVQIVGR